MPGFEYNKEELDDILTEIESEGFDTVGVQVPDGLKKEAVMIADMIEDKGLDAVIVAESTFGACDLADHKAMEMGADCLIHCGHTQFYLQDKPVEGDIPVYFVPWDMGRRNFIPILEQELDTVEENTLGIVTTTQHFDQLNEIINHLEEHGKEVVRGEHGPRTDKKSQVLGCDAVSALKIKEDVNAFLYVGSGHFHPQKIVELGKPVYVLDPVQETLYRFDAEEYMHNRKKELMRVLKYKDAEKWGVIATTKDQRSDATVDWVKTFLEEQGKDVYVFVGDRITEHDFHGFDIPIYVNCACPRMVDDFEDYALVNPQALNLLKEDAEVPENYVMTPGAP